MANYKWTSTVTAAFDSDNWDAGAGPTGPPGASHNALFDGQYNGSVTNPASEEFCANMYVSSAYTGDMGTSGSPLQVSANSGTGLFVLEGSGDMYFDSDVDHVLIRKTGNITFANNDVCESVNIFGGNSVTITPNAQLNYINVGSNQGSGPNVTVEEGSSNAVFLTINNGNVTVEQQSAPIVYQDGGRCLLSGVTTLTNHVVAGGTTYASQNDDLNVNGHAVVMAGGTFDLSGCKGTITVSDSIICHSGGFVNLDNGQTTDASGANNMIVFTGGKVKQFRGENNFIEV